MTAKCKAFILKGVSVTLSITLFTTNVLWAHAPETNFWAERKKALSPEPKKGPPLALASLPTPSVLNSKFQDPNSTQIPNYNFLNPKRLEFRKWGFVCDVGFGARGLPLECGSIRKISKPTTHDSKRLVVHIQDVHLNPEAQANIGKTVEALINQQKVDLVALEGAFGPMDFSRIRKFPYPDSIKAVADYLFKEKKISGPVYALLTVPPHVLPWGGKEGYNTPPGLPLVKHGEQSPLIIGIDDRAHYKANVEAYRQAAPLVKKYKRKLARYKEDIRQEKLSAFSPQLSAFDNKVETYRDGKISFGEYVRFLNGCEKAQSSEPLAYSQIDIFLHTLDLESSLDSPRVESDRTELLTKLIPKISKNETSELLNYSTAYRTGNLSNTEFYEHFKELCEKHGIALNRYKAMDAYIRYVLLADSINVEKVLREVTELERFTYESLAKTPEEKQLLIVSKQIYFTGKLLDFALTREEWEEYKAVIPAKAGIQVPNLSLKKVYSLDSRFRGNDNLTPFESFYREAEARDQAMAANFLKGVQKIKCAGSLSPWGRRTKGDGFHDHGFRSPSPQPSPLKGEGLVSVLVTGGFHSFGIDKQLVDAGCTVITFVPKITHVDTAEGSAYLSVFTQEKTSLDQLFAGEKLFLSPPQSPNIPKITAAYSALDVGLRHPGADIGEFLPGATTINPETRTASVTEPDGTKLALTQEPSGAVQNLTYDDPHSSLVPRTVSEFYAVACAVRASPILGLANFAVQAYKGALGELMKYKEMLKEFDRLAGSNCFGTFVASIDYFERKILESGPILENGKKIFPIGEEHLASRAIELFKNAILNFGVNFTESNIYLNVLTHVRRDAEQLASPKMQSLLGEISVCRRQLYRLMEHFLNLSGARQQQAFGIINPHLNLNSMLDKVITDERNARPRQFQAIHVQFTKGEIPTIIGDEAGLELGLAELVRNAAFSTIQRLEANWYTPYRDRSEVKIQTRYLPDENKIEILISDNGIGIAPEDLEKVRLHAFSKNNYEKAVQAGDYGVGVPTAELSITEHGGTLDIQSDTSKGTTVCIKLPLAPPETKLATEAGTKNSVESTADQVRKLFTAHPEWHAVLAELEQLKQDGAIYDYAVTGSFSAGQFNFDGTHDLDIAMLPRAGSPFHPAHPAVLFLEKINKQHFANRCIVHITLQAYGPGYQYDEANNRLVFDIVRGKEILRPILDKGTYKGERLIYLGGKNVDVDFWVKLYRLLQSQRPPIYEVAHLVRALENQETGVTGKPRIPIPDLDKYLNLAKSWVGTSAKDHDELIEKLMKAKKGVMPASDSSLIDTSKAILASVTDQPFFQRVERSIRRIDPDGIDFNESPELVAALMEEFNKNPFHFLACTFAPFLKTRAAQLGLSMDDYKTRAISDVQERRGILDVLDASLRRRKDTTMFFRDFENWLSETKIFLKNILPDKWNKRDLKIRIRNAGSSYGSEAYSLAAILEKELRTLHERLTEEGSVMEPFDAWLDRWDIQIDAFDVDPHSLLRTRLGYFSKEDLEWRGVEGYASKDIVKKEDANGFWVTDRIRNWVRPVFIDLNDPTHYPILEGDSYDITISQNTFMYLRAEHAKRPLLDVLVRSQNTTYPRLLILKEDTQSPALAVRYEADGRWEKDQNPNAERTRQNVLKELQARSIPPALMPEHVRVLGLLPDDGSRKVLEDLKPLPFVGEDAAWALGKIQSQESLGKSLLPEFAKVTNEWRDKGYRKMAELVEDLPYPGGVEFVVSWVAYLILGIPGLLIARYLYVRRHLRGPPLSLLSKNFVPVPSENNDAAPQQFLSRAAQEHSHRLGDVFSDGRMNLHINDARQSRRKEVQKIPVSRQKNSLALARNANDFFIFRALWDADHAVPAGYQETPGVPRNVLINQKPHGLSGSFFGKDNKISLFQLLSDKVKRRINMLLRQTWEILGRGDFLRRNTSLQELQNLPKHDPSPSETGLAMTNGRIDGNVVIHIRSGLYRILRIFHRRPEIDAQSSLQKLIIPISVFVLPIIVYFAWIYFTSEYSAFVQTVSDVMRASVNPFARPWESWKVYLWFLVSHVLHNSIVGIFGLNLGKSMAPKYSRFLRDRFSNRPEPQPIPEKTSPTKIARILAVAAKLAAPLRTFLIIILMPVLFVVAVYAAVVTFAIISLQLFADWRRERTKKSMDETEILNLISNFLSIGYNQKSGLTVDGYYTDKDEPARRSAASKESLHISLLGLVIEGNRKARRVVSPEDVNGAEKKAYEEKFPVIQGLDVPLANPPAAKQTSLTGTKLTTLPTYEFTEKVLKFFGIKQKSVIFFIASRFVAGGYESIRPFKKGDWLKAHDDLPWEKNLSPQEKALRRELRAQAINWVWVGMVLSSIVFGALLPTLFLYQTGPPSLLTEIAVRAVSAVLVTTTAFLSGHTLASFRDYLQAYSKWLRALTIPLQLILFVLVFPAIVGGDIFHTIHNWTNSKAALVMNPKNPLEIVKGRVYVVGAFKIADREILEVYAEPGLNLALTLTSIDKSSAETIPPIKAKHPNIYLFPVSLVPDGKYRVTFQDANGAALQTVNEKSKAVELEINIRQENGQRIIEGLLPIEDVLNDLAGREIKPMTQHRMTSTLPEQDKARLLQGTDKPMPRHTWQGRHQAAMSLIMIWGRFVRSLLSSWRDHTYNLMAFLMFFIASLIVSPWDAQPGKPNTYAEYPPSATSSSMTILYIMGLFSFVDLGRGFLRKAFFFMRGTGSYHFQKSSTVPSRTWTISNSPYATSIVTLKIVRLPWGHLPRLFKRRGLDEAALRQKAVKYAPLIEGLIMLAVFNTLNTVIPVSDWPTLRFLLIVLASAFIFAALHIQYLAPGKDGQIEIRKLWNNHTKQQQRKKKRVQESGASFPGFVIKDIFFHFPLYLTPFVYGLSSTGLIFGFLRLAPAVLWMLYFHSRENRAQLSTSRWRRLTLWGATSTAVWVWVVVAPLIPLWWFHGFSPQKAAHRTVVARLIAMDPLNAGRTLELLYHAHYHRTALVDDVLANDEFVKRTDGLTLSQRLEAANGVALVLPEFDDIENKPSLDNQIGFVVAVWKRNELSQATDKKALELASNIYNAHGSALTDLLMTDSFWSDREDLLMLLRLKLNAVQTVYNDEGTAINQAFAMPEFAKATKRLGFYEQRSVALAVSRYVKRFEAPLTDKNLGMALEFVMKLRDRYDSRMIFGPDIKVLALKGDDNEDETTMKNTDLASIVRGFGVKDVQEFVGKNRLEDFRRAIRESEGPTTILLFAHGSFGHVRVEDDVRLNWDELGGDLAATKDPANKNVLVASCRSRDTALLTASAGYHLGSFLKKGSPLFMASSNADKLSYANIFMQILAELSKQGKPLSLGDFQRALERNVGLMLYDDPVTLVNASVKEHQDTGHRMVDVHQKLRIEEQKKNKFEDLPKFPGFLPYFFPIVEINTTGVWVLLLRLFGVPNPEYVAVKWIGWWAEALLVFGIFLGTLSKGSSPSLAILFSLSAFAFIHIYRVVKNSDGSFEARWIWESNEARAPPARVLLAFVGHFLSGALYFGPLLSAIFWAPYLNPLLLTVVASLLLVWALASHAFSSFRAVHRLIHAGYDAWQMHSGKSLRVTENVARHDLSPSLYKIGTTLRVHFPKTVFVSALLFHLIAGLKVPVIASDYEKTLGHHRDPNDLFYPGVDTAINAALAEGPFFIVTGDDLVTAAKSLFPAIETRLDKNRVSRCTVLSMAGLNRHTFKWSGDPAVFQREDASFKAGISDLQKGLIENLIRKIEASNPGLYDFSTKVPEEGYKNPPRSIVHRQAVQGGALMYRPAGYFKDKTAENRFDHSFEDQKKKLEIVRLINREMRKNSALDGIVARSGSPTGIDIINTDKGVALDQIRLKGFLKENEYLVFMGDNISTGGNDADGAERTSLSVQLGPRNKIDRNFNPGRGRILVFSQQEAKEGGAAFYIRAVAFIRRIAREAGIDTGDTRGPSGMRKRLRVFKALANALFKWMSGTAVPVPKVNRFGEGSSFGDPNSLGFDIATLAGVDHKTAVKIGWASMALEAATLLVTTSLLLTGSAYKLFTDPASAVFSWVAVAALALILIAMSGLHAFFYRKLLQKKFLEQQRARGEPSQPVPNLNQKTLTSFLLHLRWFTPYLFPLFLPLVSNLPVVTWLCLALVVGIHARTDAREMRERLLTGEEMLEILNQEHLINRDDQGATLLKLTLLHLAGDFKDPNHRHKMARLLEQMRDGTILDIGSGRARVFRTFLVQQLHFDSKRVFAIDPVIRAHEQQLNLPNGLDNGQSLSEKAEDLGMSARTKNWPKKFDWIFSFGVFNDENIIHYGINAAKAAKAIDSVLKDDGRLVTAVGVLPWDHKREFDPYFEPIVSNSGLYVMTKKTVPSPFRESWRTSKDIGKGALGAVFITTILGAIIAGILLRFKVDHEFVLWLVPLTVGMILLFEGLLHQVRLGSRQFTLVPGALFSVIVAVLAATLLLKCLGVVIYFHVSFASLSSMPHLHSVLSNLMPTLLLIDIVSLTAFLGMLVVSSTWHWTWNWLRKPGQALAINEENLQETPPPPAFIGHWTVKKPATLLNPKDKAANELFWTLARDGAISEEDLASHLRISIAQIRTSASHLLAMLIMGIGNQPVSGEAEWLLKQIGRVAGSAENRPRPAAGERINPATAQLKYYARLTVEEKRTMDTVLAAINQHERGRDGRPSLSYDLAHAIRPRMEIKSPQIEKTFAIGLALAVRKMFGIRFKSVSAAMKKIFEEKSNLVTLVHVNGPDDLERLEEALDGAKTLNQKYGDSSAVVGAVLPPNSTDEFEMSVREIVKRYESVVPAKVAREKRTDIQAGRIAYASVFKKLSELFDEPRSNKARELFAELERDDVDRKHVVVVGVSKTPHSASEKLLSIMIGLVPVVGGVLKINLRTVLEAARSA